MRQPWVLSVSGRYLRGGSQRGFVGFISWLAMLGAAIGVAVLVLVLSVFNGFSIPY